MSNNKSMPLFSSAPRITLTIGDSLVGYAIGFNINISVDIQSIYALGNYGPVSLEPTFYNIVTGTMQIIRLSRPSARQALKDLAVSKNIDGRTDNKSSALDWNGAAAVGSTEASNKTVTPVGQSNLYSHLDPSLVLVSALFDMTVQLRVPSTTTSTETIIDKTTTKVLDTTNLERTVNWMSIRGCRLTGRSTNLTMGQIINEPISFNGLLVSPMNDAGVDTFSFDSAISELSGTGVKNP